MNRAGTGVVPTRIPHGRSRNKDTEGLDKLAMQLNLNTTKHVRNTLGANRLRVVNTRIVL